jgi:hypothetical protein
MSKAAVSVGDQVYLQEGADPFGSVRYVHPHELIVYIEGMGEVVMPAEVVESVHDGKVIIDERKLPQSTRIGIASAHRREEPHS